MTLRAEADSPPAPAGSMLDLVDVAATGHGSVHFIGEEAEPTPIATLWDDSERAARWIAANVGSGSNVAAVLTNTRACVTTLLGAWRAGCTLASLPLPARGMSTQVYVEQLDRFCAAGDTSTLMVDPDHAPMLAGARLDVHTFAEPLSGGPRTSFPGEPALVQFTSGSMGTPKGIYLTLDAVGANVAAIVAVMQVEAGDASCSWLPLSHDMGLIGQFLAALHASSPRYGHECLTLMKPESFVASPRSWLRTCSQTGSTITTGPNFALDLAIRSSARIGSIDLSRLRSIIVGSEPVFADTLLRFADAFAPVGFRSDAFCPAYGLAEATLAVTIASPDEPWRAMPQPAGATPAGGARPIISNGAPLERTDVRVTGPAGEVGSIEFRSPSLLSHYIGADVRLTDDGFFPTGDIGWMDDGELFVVGRGDDVIVVAGRNLYPADIETALEHDAIRPGCVAAVAAPDRGLAIVVEPRGAKVSSADLEMACTRIRTLVARQTGCAPATVAFVPRGSLPKTPSGKLRRGVIRDALATDVGLLARVDFE